MAIKIGVINSLTGTMATSEKPLVDAALLAVEEINSAGGVLGDSLEVTVKDGQSTVEGYHRATLDLLIDHGIDHLFGCWTSESRKVVKTLVEDRNALLWYPVQYEGLEQSGSVFYTGSTLHQQGVPAIEWSLGLWGRRVYLVGSDYVYPRTANQLLRALLEDRGGKLVGERYRSLGDKDFKDICTEIVRKQPDFIISTINGDSNLAFFRQFREAGLSPDQCPVVSMSVSEAEVATLGPSLKGHYACWGGFQGLDISENRTFLDRFRNRYGSDRMISDPIATAYAQIFLWKNVVEKAGTTDVKAVEEASEGVSFDGPMGKIILGEDHHVVRPAYLGQITRKGTFDVIKSRVAIEAKPWLGLEDHTFSLGGLLKESLGAFPEHLHTLSELNRKNEHLQQTKSELEEKKAELDRSNSRLREMVNVSEQVERMSRHDLKSPLGSIINLPEFLLETRDDLDEEIQQCLRMINRSGLKMLEMINHSLDLFRLETGSYIFEPSQVDLIPILNRIRVDQGSKMSHPDDLVMEFDGVTLAEENFLEVWGEEHLIYPMLANLTSNAVEASVRGFEVRIEVRTSEETVEILIENDGVLADGIEERFFEKYATAGKKNGTGLGTYSSRLMARAMRGDVVLDNSKEGKVRLVVTLPKAYASGPVSNNIWPN